ncbi:MAG: hypothetical protein JWN64_846 [Parcubacteria group bacterium]|nr:hypothetical protein [Parcubacteria group bacterium]
MFEVAAILLIPTVILSFIILGLFRLLTKVIRINRFGTSIFGAIVFRLCELAIYIGGMTYITNIYAYGGKMTFSAILAIVFAVYYAIYLGIDLLIHRKRLS